MLSKNPIGEALTYGGKEMLFFLAKKDYDFLIPKV
jgi:hypothetical protein